MKETIAQLSHLPDGVEWKDTRFEVKGLTDEYNGVYQYDDAHYFNKLEGGSMYRLPLYSLISMTLNGFATCYVEREEKPVYKEGDLYYFEVDEEEDCNIPCFGRFHFDEGKPTFVSDIDIYELSQCWNIEPAKIIKVSEYNHPLTDFVEAKEKGLKIRFKDLDYKKIEKAFTIDFIRFMLGCIKEELHTLRHPTRYDVPVVSALMIIILGLGFLAYCLCWGCVFMAMYSIYIVCF